MPESLCFLSFWIFTWYVLKLDHSSTYPQWIFASIIFSMMTLIKPHALFILPSVVLYIAYLIRQATATAWVVRALSMSAVFVLVTIATKMMLGFVFAGKAGVTLFGTTYNSIASTMAPGVERYVEFATLAGTSLVGHFLALSLLFGTPLAFVLFNLRKVFSRSEAKNMSSIISLYTFLIFATLIPVVALFTATVANFGPYESPFRMHMRYYNFAFPLFLLVAASTDLCAKKKGGAFASLLVAIPIIVSVIYGYFTALFPYIPSLVDSPELRGFTYNSLTFHVLTAVGLLSLLCWIYNYRLASRIFLYGFAPLSVISGFYFSSAELRGRLVPDIFDKAGIFTHEYLEGQTSTLAVMGSNLSSLLRCLFYVDDAQAVVVEIPAGSAADLSKIPGDKKWLLLIGNHAPPSKFHFKLAMNGFSLFRIWRSDEIDFKRTFWPGILSRAEGLSSSESWGTWSDGPKVTLEFVAPLPTDFILHLTANAFAPSVGRNFNIQIGSQSADFMLSDSPRELTFPFHLTELATSIAISVPSPTSPRELGLSADNRKLGIGLHRLTVEPVTR
jgi:phosphoglycerol transferase